ncbi:MAG: hypothetical protein VX737_02480 [Pseudomonadota bacterium]|nr:hypothetical protein [Pseudomonadota bacterium]
MNINQNSLDSREQEVIMSLSGHCSFTESSSDASVAFNTSAILKEAWHHFHWVGCSHSLILIINGLTTSDLTN